MLQRRKLMALSTTSKCYIFNLAICFDLRGSSSLELVVKTTL